MTGPGVDAGPTAPSAKAMNTRVLVVDDQQQIHDDFREMLLPRRTTAASDDLVAAFMDPPSHRSGLALPPFDLRHARNGEEGCAAIAQAHERNEPIAVAFVDVRMPPGIDGVEAVRRMRAVDRDLEVVIMTAYSDKPLSAIIGDVDLLHKILYVRKPFAREEVQQISLSLVKKWNLERDVAEGRRQLTHSHRRLEAVLDATGDAIAMYDRAERLVFANRWYEALFDLTPSELRQLSLRDADARFEGRSRESWQPGPTARTGQSTPHLVEPRRRRGGPPGVSLFYRFTQSVSDAAGEPIGDLVIYRDVSREIEIERMKAEVHRLRSELATTYAFDGFIGSSPGMRRVSELMQRVVGSDVSVLVTGESGTGKELVAKALHFNGPRKRGPFVAVNCAAVPETLMETEMFGHERGAFSGATAQRAGCFERASGGTLLLDEIGDMPAALQAKLLRVLQEREVTRVGGRTTIPVDVRVVASTHRDLEAAIRDGTFREDLYYRLAVFPIDVPPLRERHEDIPLLAEHFRSKHADRLGAAVKGISPAATALLARYGWPGNVRELENVVCRSLVLETSDVLQAATLPPELVPPGVTGAKTGPPGATDARPTPGTLADMERGAIAAALEGSGHNLTRTAAALGIDRTTLHRKLKKYGLRGSRA